MTLAPGFKIDVYASGVNSARQMAWGDKGTLFVGSFGVGTVYAIEGGKEAAEQIGQVLATKWSLATALSLLAWYIFAPQCASTLAVIRRETGSWKWMAVTFGYMLVLAYAASFVTYNIAVSLGAG